MHKNKERAAETLTAYRNSSHIFQETTWLQMHKLIITGINQISISCI